MVTLTRDLITVPPGPKPGFDHADVFVRDGKSRLYVAHTGANRIDMFDCQSNTYIGPLTGHPGVAGVLVDPQRGLLLTTDRGCAQMSVYRCEDNAYVGAATVGQHPNGITYDASRRNAFVFNLGEPLGLGCSASVVPLDEMRARTRIPLPGRPRWAEFDDKLGLVYVNIREPARIVIIDAERMSIQRHIDVPAAGPHGLIRSGETLFCAADAGVLVAIDRRDGHIINSVALPGEPDVLMRDAELGRLFVAIGNPGVIVVIDEATLEVHDIIETGEGAHTIAWDPVTRSLYAFLPGPCGALVIQEQ